jgi:hypothetical protein
LISRLKISPDFWRRPLAAVCAALVLALAVLAACPTFHAWLHGEKHLDNDDGCAVVVFIHGLLAAASDVAALIVVLRLLAEDASEPAWLFLAEARFARPFSLGPPAT